MRTGKKIILSMVLLTLIACSDSSDPTNPPTGFTKLDLVIALDSSGSMANEVVFVQNELNNFAQYFLSASVDLNIVLIASSPGFCIPAPLGSGTCPADENLPAYRHIDQTVGSTNALQLIIDHYDNWEPSLRDDALHAFMVISDDNASGTVNDVDGAIKFLDARLAAYKFYAIVASLDPDPVNTNKCNGFSANAGSLYIDLATSTGGTWSDLCDQNFNVSFTDLATAMLADF